MRPLRIASASAVLVDDAAAGHVDDAQAGLGLGQAARSPIRPTVSGVLATWRVTKSAAPHQLVEVDQVDVELPGPLRRDEGVVGDEPHAERAGPLRHELADAPEPDDAEHLVGQLDALPLRLRSQRPAVSAAWACGTLRAWARSSAIVCSAAERMFDCGAFTTITPRSVAASTSTLSRPMPARPTTTRSVPAASTSAVTLVAERMIRAWAPGDGGRAAPRATARAARRRRGRPAAGGPGRLRRSLGDQHPGHRRHRMAGRGGPSPARPDRSATIRDSMSSAGVEAEDLAVDRSSASSERTMLGAWRNRAARPRRRRRQRQALRLQGVDDHLGLRRRHAPRPPALEDDERAGKPSVWWIGERSR